MSKAYFSISIAFFLDRMINLGLHFTFFVFDIELSVPAVTPLFSAASPA
jgi:hypothetical protein